MFGGHRWGGIAVDWVTVAVGVLAGTPRLNVQSGHSEALKVELCCVGTTPCKGEDIRQKRQPTYRVWEPSQAT